MECQIRIYDENVADNVLSKFLKVCRKLTSLETVYAGLLLCFVPSVLCEPEWQGQLTYEDIYNSTNYAQIPPHIQRPYTSVTSFSSSYSTNNRFNEHTKVEDAINYIEDDDISKGQLLVGFARDPFRTSIPEEDYRKGVREIPPQSYTNKGENRGKRGVLHLANMIYCATGCDPLSYKGYGCYCGFLGAGRPTDGIDRCCKMHDQCYENIYCPFYTVYFQPYYWKCYREQPLCALENYHTQNQLINGCAGRLCECDRQFAMCVRRYQCPKKRALCRSSPIRLLQNILMFK